MAGTGGGEAMRCPECGTVLTSETVAPPAAAPLPSPGPLCRRCWSEHIMERLRALWAAEAAERRAPVGTLE